MTERDRLTADLGRPYGGLFDLPEHPKGFRSLWDDRGHRAVRDELRLVREDKVMDTDAPLARRISGS